MKIPIFLSCPTQLNRKQNASRKVILNGLDELQLEPRALGRSDYPKDVPLKEVYAIAKHCHGGIILGYEQFYSETGAFKRGAKEEVVVNKSTPVFFPTPWNQLEAGILFGLKLPLLIFKEKGIHGGVFDVGTTEVFVHETPSPRPSIKQKKEFKEILLKWHAHVSHHYYEY